MRRALLTAFLSLACTCCAQSPGAPSASNAQPTLALPSGSVVVDRTDSASLDPSVAFPQTAPQPGKDGSVGLTFDNPAGWKAVTAHFDREMKRQGYHDALTAPSATLSLLLMKGESGKKAREARKSMRMYEKRGSLYAVSLTDLSLQTALLTRAAAQKQGGKPIGQFTLSMRLKKK